MTTPTTDDVRADLDAWLDGTSPEGTLTHRDLDADADRVISAARQLAELPSPDDVAEEDRPALEAMAQRLADEARPTLAIAPGDLEAAEKAMNRLAYYNRQIRKVEAWTTHYIDRVQQFLESRTKYARDRVAYYDGLLGAWLLSEIAATPKGKRAKMSRQLPSGAIKSRKAGAVVVHDELAFMAWARANAPDLIVTPPAPEPCPAPSKVIEAAVAIDETGRLVLVKDGKPTDQVVPGLSDQRTRKVTTHPDDIEPEDDTEG